MENQATQQSRVRRTVNDLVMAEMFLVQATIESAAVIGGGLSELGRQVSGEEAESERSVSEVIQSTAGQAIEAYTSRFKYLRDLVDSDS